MAVELRDDALILTFQNGPTNALTAPLRAELIARIEGAGPPCRRIILTAVGPAFSSAAPLTPDLSRPTLAELCRAVEQSPRPVIVVLTGLVLGPGAELALAARGRIAAPGMRLAFPEVALGLCPEGGSTLRLPRLIGVEGALDLLLTGRPVSADEAMALGLVDQVSPIPVSAALSTLTLPARRSLVPTAPDTIAAARKARPRALPAALRLIACVEAAGLLPAEAHQAFEAVAREDLEASPEAAALRAVASADRRAALLPPAIARHAPQPLTRLALYGADPALAVLANAALSRGVEVAWHHPGPEARAANLAALAEVAGRASRHAHPSGNGQMTVTDLSLEAPDTSGLQIHSPDAAVPTNQSFPEAVQLVLGGADMALGLSLAPRGPVCELALPEETGTDTARVALALDGLRRLGWQPLIVGRRPVVGQRVDTAGETALQHLIRAGVPGERIARLVARFGLTHLPAAPAHPADEVSDQALLARWLAAQANEGLRLLDEGIARRPSDIDLAMVLGRAFPRWQGGPMHLADRRGLMALRRDLREWAADDPVWAPAPILDRLIRDGRSLADLNAA